MRNMSDHNTPDGFVGNGIVPVNNAVADVHYFTGVAYLNGAVMFQNPVHGFADNSAKNYPVYGKSVILDSEYKEDGIKTPEGILDGKLFDIKGVEGTGKRNIIAKISDASFQGVETVVLYFHDAILFDLQKIINAYHGYLKLSKTMRVQNVYYIVDNKLHKIE